MTARSWVIGSTALLLMLSGWLVGGGQADETSRLARNTAGRQVAAFLAAFNDGDQSAMERFFADNLSPQAAQRRGPGERAAMTRRVQTDSGGVILRRVEKLADDEVVIVVEGKRQGLFRFSFAFEKEEPHRLLGIRFEMMERDDDAAPLPPMTMDGALATGRREVDAAAAADDFSGVVLVARDGTALLLDAWGQASKEFGVANRTDTRFNLGSINKVFTKLAVAQLVSRGTLSLDDRLGRWLPDYPNEVAREKIAIRQLVEMSSGIGDFFGAKFAATAKDRFRSNADFLAMFADEPLLFEPGSSQRYSNGGYVVLGEVVARASGESYYDYVRTHIFVPAGMTSTDSYEADAVVPNLAEGYTRSWDGKEHEGEPRRRNLYTRPARGSAAGGGYSTAEDLLRFTRALLSDSLAPPAWTEWLLGGPEPATTTTASGPHVHGGIALAGGAPGINAALEIDLERKSTVIVLSNYDPPAATRLARKIRRILEAVAEGGPPTF
jgi:D-alanyl-D-alanine carboxypeptidase